MTIVVIYVICYIVNDIFFANKVFQKALMINLIIIHVLIWLAP